MSYKYQQRIHFEFLKENLEDNISEAVKTLQWIIKNEVNDPFKKISLF